MPVYNPSRIIESIRTDNVHGADWLSNAAVSVIATASLKEPTTSFDDLHENLWRYAIEDVTGEKPFSNPLYSKSDVRTPLLIAGIPNVGYGPLEGDLASTGGEDEWVDLDDYIRAIKVTARIIMEWCG